MKAVYGFFEKLDTGSHPSKKIMEFRKNGVDHFGCREARISEVANVQLVRAADVEEKEEGRKETEKEKKEERKN